MGKLFPKYVTVQISDALFLSCGKGIGGVNPFFSSQLNFNFSFSACSVKTIILSSSDMYNII